jgi:hypothetical protein
MRLVKDPTVFYPFEQHDSFRWKCHPVQYKFVLEGSSGNCHTVKVLVNKSLLIEKL